MNYTSEGEEIVDSNPETVNPPNPLHDKLCEITDLLKEILWQLQES